MSVDTFDVAICGGGLAGLALARQLAREQPDRSVVVIERETRPLPELTHKVGEATTEVGAFYLADVLGLEEYFAENHRFKMGLRFFFQSESGRFEDRPEIGLASLPLAKSYTIDRGTLENDLRGFVEEDGVDLREGCKVREVRLAEGDGLHEIVYEDGAGSTAGVRARWLVDATGRRRLVQRMLGLDRRMDARCSAAWFRVAGRVDVEEFVPAEAGAWHARVPEGFRHQAVCHLVDEGYWVWVIPMPGGATSVGIVAPEDAQPFDAYNTRENALAWLGEHEPELAADLADREWLDFRLMRRYSYTSEKVLSAEGRWACVGEAGVFADPLYSPGIDLIAFANAFAADMIRRDFGDGLDPKVAEEYDWIVRGLNDLLTHNFQIGYSLFGHPVAATAKLIWDVAVAWSVYSPQMFNLVFLDPGKASRYRKETSRFFFLTRRMHDLFVEWGSRSPSRAAYDFIDYLGIPFLRQLPPRNLKPGKDIDELAEDQRANMRMLEELAQALFLVAVEDVLPDELDRFREPVWIDAWSVSLDPDRWEADGLFEPRTEPRDLAPMREQIRGLFRFDAEPALA